MALIITKRKVSDAAARHTDPHTSHEAAAAVDTAYLEGVVVMDLKKNGPGTTLQIAERVGILRDSISPRMAPLCRKGKIEDSGKRIAYKSKRKSIVWRAVKS